MSQLKIIGPTTKAPKLPPILSVSALVVLMPSLLFAANFPTLLNSFAAIGMVIAVILDRISIRTELRKEFVAGQELLTKYVEEINAAAAAASSADKDKAPKNKDGETLH